MQITIARRFCGPHTSGNGGYTCGRIASFIEGAAEVTLRAPPPLDTPLDVRRQDGTVVLLHGGAEIAHGRAVTLALEVPAPPAWDEAVAAGARYNGHKGHAYDTCFVCGPSRGPGDGLRIFCGPWKNGMVAGTWLPDASLAGANGLVAPEFLWSAIDCPGSWSVIGRSDADAPVPAAPSSMLLGRLTGRVVRTLKVGEPCTALGWLLDVEGRKYHVGSAVHTRAGDLVAFSRGTWFAPKPPG